MSTGAITDYFLQLGWDDSKARKGLNSLEKRLETISENFNRSFKIDVPKLPQPTTNRLPSTPMGVPNEDAILNKREAHILKNNRLIRETSYGLKNLGVDIGKINKLPILDMGGKSLSHFKKELRSAAAVFDGTAAATRRLQSAQVNYKDAVKRVTHNQRLLNKEMARGGGIAKGFKQSINNLARSYLSIYAAMAGGGHFVRTGQQLIALDASLLASTGSAEAAAEAYTYVEKTSLRLGTSLNESVKGYSKIAVAARKTGMSVGETREIFMAANEMAVAFNLSADNTAGVMRTFDQMLSKGKIQAEELRNQLGDRVPGAFYIAAEAMGRSAEELDKMMEQGKLSSKEFMVPFAKQLRKVAREGNALEIGLSSSQRQMQRMGTSYETVIRKAFDSGAEAGLASMYREIADSITDLTPAFKVLGRILGFVTNVIGKVVRVVSLTIKPFVSFLDIITNVNEEGDKTNAIFKIINSTFQFFVDIVEMAHIELEIMRVKGGTLNVTLAALGNILLGVFSIKILLKFRKGVWAITKAVTGLGFAMRAVKWGGGLMGLGGAAAGRGAATAGGVAGSSYFAKRAMGRGGKKALLQGAKFAAKRALPLLIPVVGQLVSAGLLAYGAYSVYKGMDKTTPSQSSYMGGATTIDKRSFQVDIAVNVPKGSDLDEYKVAKIVKREFNNMILLSNKPEE